MKDEIRVHDARGRLLRRLALPPRLRAEGSALDPAGRRLAVAAPRADGRSSELLLYRVHRSASAAAHLRRPGPARGPDLVNRRKRAGARAAERRPVALPAPERRPRGCGVGNRRGSSAPVQLTASHARRAGATPSGTRAIPWASRPAPRGAPDEGQRRRRCDGAFCDRGSGRRVGRLQRNEPCPLWGTPRHDGSRVLMRLDRRTLRPLANSRIRLPRGIGWWDASFSPDCRRLAIAGRRRGEIVIVNLERARIEARLRIGGRLAPYGIEWPVPDRLIVFSGSYLAPRFVTVSIPDGRVVGVHTERAEWFATQGTALGVVALGAPTRQVGAAHLLLARPDGSALRVTLDRLPAGTERLRRRPGWARRQFLPGLAVNEATAGAYRGGGRASAAAGGPGGLARAAPCVSPIRERIQAGERREGRAARRLSRGPPGSATGCSRCPARIAGTPTLIRPFGLQLVDTATWSTRSSTRCCAGTCARGRCCSGPMCCPRRRGGPAAPRAWWRTHWTDAACSPVSSGDERVGLWGAVWPYAHLTIRGRRRKLVVDLRSGRTVRVFPGTTWPFPLLD